MHIRQLSRIFLLCRKIWCEIFICALKVSRKLRVFTLLKTSTNLLYRVLKIDIFFIFISRLDNIKNVLSQFQLSSKCHDRFISYIAIMVFTKRIVQIFYLNILMVSEYVISTNDKNGNILENWLVNIKACCNNNYRPI